MGRKSLRTIVEGICRTLQEPISVRELVRQVTQQAGVPERPGTLLTVREALSALPFIVKAGPDAYLPAWLVLDGKAFRLRPPPGGWRGELARQRLELVAEVLENPRLVWKDGRPIGLALAEPADGAGLDALVAQLLHRLQEKAARKDDPLSRFLAAALAPYRLPHGVEDRCDLVVRYDASARVLRVTAQPEGARDEERIRQEDRRFCEFALTQVRAGREIMLRDLFLRAYAQIPGFGTYPGSPPQEALAAEPRLRVLAPPDGSEAQAVVVRADDLALARRLQERWGLVRSVSAAVRRQQQREHRQALEARIREHLEALGRDEEQVQAQLGLLQSWGTEQAGDYATPQAAQLCDDELLARWQAHLEQAGLGEQVRQRKLEHVRTLSDYLASGQDHEATRLVGATGPHLMSFFFWSYPRRYPSSPSDAESFTLDVRDFYRWLQQQGLLTDSRFAELPYRLRRHVAERVRLYSALDPDDPAWERLYELLFLGEV